MSWRTMREGSQKEATNSQTKQQESKKTTQKGKALYFEEAEDVNFHALLNKTRRAIQNVHSLK